MQSNVEYTGMKIRTLHDPQKQHLLTKLHLMQHQHVSISSKSSSVDPNATDTETASSRPELTQHTLHKHQNLTPPISERDTQR